MYYRHCRQSMIKPDLGSHENGKEIMISRCCCCHPIFSQNREREKTYICQLVNLLGLAAARLAAVKLATILHPCRAYASE